MEASLYRTIGAMSRHGGFHQKVGITANPKVRWTRHRADGWRRMDVIYMSWDHDDVGYLERKLIRRFREGKVNSPGYHYNAVGGGGGRVPGAGPFYLYVVRAPRNARLFKRVSETA